ncbi:MAG: acyl carrier protein [Clostridiaceae bacterium]|jgi:acyl carrier protein|nr:acyl carrier protein [Clostridiaceae bacterium]
MPDKAGNTIAQIVSRALAAVTGQSEDQFSEHTDLIQDLNMDSLALYELVIELEEHYHVQITDEDIDRIKTLGDIISYIERKIGSGS